MLPATEPLLLAANRGYRYGDGLFETIKVVKGKPRLASYHFDRLFAGLGILKFDVPKLFTQDKLQGEILDLTKKNKCEELARVRLSVSRGNGGLYDDDRSLQYIIECWPLNESVNQLNENGLVVDIFPDARKSCDGFSNLKSANFLPYTMAAVYAREHRLNDCFVLNSHERICDSTIANVFWIKDETVFTNPLGEGCVNGVMRRHLLEHPSITPVQEKLCEAADLETADEIFLTNAINGIRWVRQFRNKTYDNSQIAEIYKRVFKTIIS